MKKWVKPNGTKITTNEMPETIAYVTKLGWLPEEDVEVETPEEDVEVETPEEDVEVETPEPVKSRRSKY